MLRCRTISVGVGFSYADFGETVETTEHAAKNVHAFLTIFFETFSQFKGRPLHLAGESYGVSLLLSTFLHPRSDSLNVFQGRYLPAFASYVYDQNQVAKEEGRDTLNLTSVLIGNGVVDFTKCVDLSPPFRTVDRSMCTGSTAADTKWNAGPQRCLCPSRRSAPACA